MRTLPIPAVLAAAFLGGSLCAQSILFTDDFETDTSATWNVLEGSGNGTPDYTAEFNFDYSQIPYTVTDRVTGVAQTKTIPPAPNSAAGGTRGLKLTVNNNDDVESTSGVSVLLKNQNFSGNYALRADLWMNYNGTSFGGTGSTEFGTFGIHHSADKLAWATTGLTDSDGVWFAVAGEGGAAEDYRTYEGVAGAAPIQLKGLDAGFLDRDGNVTTEFETNPDQTPNEPLWAMFPSPEYETPGAPGKHWVEVEVAQRDGRVVWKMNGYVIAERDNASGFNSGTVMIGTMDVFASIASPKAENFVLFDNVRVVNLDAEAALATVKVEATDAEAAEPGGDTATFTFTRTGDDLSQPLTVNYRVSGTATAGVDYKADLFTTGTLTLPANAETATLTLEPLDDLVGEPEETVVVTVVGSRNYEVRDALQATARLLDDGDKISVQVRTVQASAFEAAPDVPATFDCYRLGDLSSDLTVKFSLGGTATSGADYEPLGSSAVIPAGLTNVIVSLSPKDDALAEPAETVVLTLEPDAAYAIGAAGSATVTLGDNDPAPGQVVFADDFNADSATRYALKFGAGNNVPDYQAQFAYDYSADSIPAAPQSTDNSTKGLKLTVNKDDPTASGAAGINVYPLGVNVNGDFALRMDMYLTFDPEAAGTTEHALFGINHTGTFTNRHGIAGSDGVWFAVETDGSASRGGTYLGYVGNPTAAPAVQTLLPDPFDPYFLQPPFLAAGTASGQWVDVEVTQIAKVITWKINGITILTRPNDTAYPSGTVMLGYMDSYNSIGSPNNFVLFDNLRVVSFRSEATPSTITGIEVVGGNAQMTFTAPSGEASQFSLLSASVVGGPYNAAAGAMIEKTGEGQFRATVPIGAAASQYYRIRQ